MDQYANSDIHLRTHVNAAYKASPSLALSGACNPSLCTLYSLEATCPNYHHAQAFILFSLEIPSTSLRHSSYIEPPDLCNADFKLSIIQHIGTQAREFVQIGPASITTYDYETA